MTKMVTLEIDRAACDDKYCSDDDYLALPNAPPRGHSEWLQESDRRNDALSQFTRQGTTPV